MNTNYKEEYNAAKLACMQAQTNAMNLAGKLEHIRTQNIELRKQILEETEKGEKIVNDILNLKLITSVFLTELSEASMSWKDRMRVYDPATRPQYPLPKIGRPVIS